MPGLTYGPMFDALAMGRSRKTLKELDTVLLVGKFRLYNRITWHGWILSELDRQKVVGYLGYRADKYTETSGFALIAVKYH